MLFSSRSRMSILVLLLSIVTVMGGILVTGAIRAAATPAHAATTLSYLRCGTSSLRCPELKDSETAFGHYVGHDEPGTLFYSNVPGSGNHMRYQLTLPSDPSAANPQTPGKSYNFQIDSTFWFGMALCATESYPEQVKTCTPDSDKNIVDPSISARHPEIGRAAV